MHAASRNAVIGKAARLGLSEKRAPPATNPDRRQRNNRPAKRANGLKVIAFVRYDKPMMGNERAPVFANPKRFMDLREGDCRWPGDGKPGPDMMFCAAPAMPGYSYCGPHCRIAHAKPIPTRDRRQPALLL